MGHLSQTRTLLASGTELIFHGSRNLKDQAQQDLSVQNSGLTFAFINKEKHRSENFLN